MSKCNLNVFVKSGDVKISSEICDTRGAGIVVGVAIGVIVGVVVGIVVGVVRVGIGVGTGIGVGGVGVGVHRKTVSELDKIHLPAESR